MNDAIFPFRQPFRDNNGDVVVKKSETTIFKEAIWLNDNGRHQFSTNSETFIIEMDIKQKVGSRINQLKLEKKISITNLAWDANIASFAGNNKRKEIYQ